jgi:hypothetical protein
MTTTHLYDVSVSVAHPFHKRPFSIWRNAVTLVAILAGLAQAAFAGSASSQTHSLSFSIADETGHTIQSEDVSGIVSYDPNTGALSTPSAGTPLTGNWTWSNTDVVTGQTLAQAVLNWHTDTKGANGLWLSIVQLQATGNVDPFLSYSFSAKNNTGTNQTYSFSYGESIAPSVSGNYSIYADIAGSLTHGAISPVAQLTPTIGNIQTLKVSTDGGTTFVNAGVDVGLAQTRTATGTTVFGPISQTAVGNLNSIDYWQFDVGFTLTPGKDAAGLSGFAELVAIPEPSSYAAVLGAVVLGAAMVYRRQKEEKLSY